MEHNVNEGLACPVIVQLPVLVKDHICLKRAWIQRGYEGTDGANQSNYKAAERDEVAVVLSHGKNHGVHLSSALSCAPYHAELLVR